MGYIFCGLFSFISAIADQPHVLIKTDKRQNGLFFLYSYSSKVMARGRSKRRETEEEEAEREREMS